MRYNPTQANKRAKATPTMPPTRRQITRSDLRSLIIAKQSLGDCPDTSLVQLIRDLGCVQLDPISTVERSHLLVLWSRLETVDTAELDRLLWEEHSLFEYWAHAASIVPTSDYPVHQWNMRQVQASKRWPKWFAERGAAELESYVLNELRERGPLLSREIEDDTERYQSAWWSGRYVPRMLQFLWTRGDVMIAGREGKQRRWGLTEQVLPETVTAIDPWTDDQITHYAAQVAVKALGTATPKQIRYHYTRDRYPDLKNVLETLVTEGAMERVDIVENGEALPGDWVIHTDDLPLLEGIQRGEGSPSRTTLLSPFDNLICDRDRTELLWDFRFRIEIYVPKAKREYGYYVLPILHEDQLVGRIDPTFDRKTGTFHVNNVYREPSSPRNRRMLRRIRRAVENLAAFVGAERIEWGNVPDEWTALVG
jgi:uncharacterized protein YcaQ